MDKIRMIQIISRDMLQYKNKSFMTAKFGEYEKLFEIENNVLKISNKAFKMSVERFERTLEEFLN